MKPKVRVATVWLDGCAGCHMSLLDMDEAIIPIAKRIDADVKADKKSVLLLVNRDGDLQYLGLRLN